VSHSYCIASVGGSDTSDIQREYEPYLGNLTDPDIHVPDDAERKDSHTPVTRRATSRRQGDFDLNTILENFAGYRVIEKHPNEYPDADV
jgi:hypothetical protein